MSVTLVEARKLIEVGIAKAEELGVKMVVAVVDEQGHPVAVHRMDGANWVPWDLTIAEAFTSAAFRRNGADLKVLENAPFFRSFANIHGGRPFAGLGSLILERDGVIQGVLSAGGAIEEIDLQIAKAAVAAWAS
jgi:glc operon protein GlcG